MGIIPWYLPFSYLIPSILVIYCDQDDYGPVPGGGVETGAKGVQAVVVIGQGGFGRDAYGGLGGGTDGGGGVYIWDGERYRLSQWEDNVANITLDKETNAPLAYATGLEHHHPIMSMLG